MLPSILNQHGADGLTSLRGLIEVLCNLWMKKSLATREKEIDKLSELVNFDEVSKNEVYSTESTSEKKT